MIKKIMDENDKINLNGEELAVLEKYFPACFDREHKFDIVKFQELLKDKVDFTKEGYGLNFLGKSYARLLASLETTTVIKPDSEHNNKPENKDSQNIYISGDNLDALKHLLKSYAGQVKCIYIDPPYNTGDDGFVYNDKFQFTEGELVEKLNISEDEARRILDLTSRGSASHSAWLTFMYPRLLLARDMLKPEGVIFISIDDNENSNLKLLCDSVFGEANYVGELIWQSATDNNLRQISIEHEYVLCYAKSADSLPKWALESKKAKIINEQYKILREQSTDIVWIQSELRKWIKENKDLLSGVTHYDNVDERGVYSNSSNSSNTKPGGYTFDIIHPITGKPCVKPAYGWRWREDTFWEYDKNGDVEWGKDETTQPHIKKRIESVEEQLKSVYYEDGRIATKLLEELFGSKKIFNNPKPVNLIRRLIDFSTACDDIIMDFFSGSATTAESTLRSNLMNRNCKYIVIQLPEDLDKKYLIAPKDDKTQIKNAIDFLDSVGRAHTLDNIGIERIIRAAAKIKSENPDTDVDLGFKHFTLEEPTAQTIDKLDSFNRNTLISDENILKEFGVETVLTTWLNRDGYGLACTPQEIKFADYTAYYIGKHLYLLHSNFNEAALKALFEKLNNDPSFNPENIVVFGYSFNEWTINESLETNLRQIPNKKPNIDIRY